MSRSQSQADLLSDCLQSIGARAALMTAAVDKRVAKARSVLAPLSECCLPANQQTQPGSFSFVGQVVAAHPVQLPKETLRLVRQKVLLMWAKDDKAGQVRDVLAAACLSWPTSCAFCTAV